MSQCNTIQFRIVQELRKKEEFCGIPEYLTGAEGGLETQVGSTFDAEIEMFDNDVARASLTRTAKIPKAVKGTQSVTALMKGSGDLAIAPEIAEDFEGCGMTAPLPTVIAQISSQSGQFDTGETIVGGTSGEVALVVLPEIEGTDEIFILSTGAFTPGETITGDDSGATAVLDSEAAGGFVQFPVSGDFARMTRRSENDGFSREMNGSCGTFALNANANEPISAQFTFTGRVPNHRHQVLTSQSGNFVLDEEITDGTIIAKVVKICTPSDPYLIYRVLNAPTVEQKSEGFPLGATITGSTSGETADTDSIAYKPFGTQPMSSGLNIESGNPPILQNAGLELNDGFKPSVAAFTFDIQNEVVVQEDFNETYGLAPATINAREPMYTLDPLVFSDEDWAIHEDWRLGKLSKGFGLMAGDEPGNRIFTFIAKQQTQNVTGGDRDGSSVFNIESMALGEDDAEFFILYC